MNEAQRAVIDAILRLGERLDGSALELADALQLVGFALADKTNPHYLRFVNQESDVSLTLCTELDYITQFISDHENDDEDWPVERYQSLSEEHTSLQATASAYVSQFKGSTDFYGLLGQVGYPNHLTRASICSHWQGTNTFLLLETDLSHHRDSFTTEISCGLTSSIAKRFIRIRGNP